MQKRTHESEISEVSSSRAASVQDIFRNKEGQMESLKLEFNKHWKQKLKMGLESPDSSADYPKKRNRVIGSSPNTGPDGIKESSCGGGQEEISVGE
ncbi:hypothetical protein STEG23_019109 [Scotinomys teguina]